MYLIEPAYQQYVWGGDRIPVYFHRSLPAGRYAESWEISDRLEGMSIVGNGPWKGKTLQELLHSEREKIVGAGKRWEKFPLLIKIIDAKENLSVQIHPDEEAAKRLGGEPKTEMWVALEKSSVYAGLQTGITQKDFLEALKYNTVEPLLRKYSLEKGEAIFIPAGLIHAICGDSLLLEVQQNSNTTYRLYDWGRVGRALHLDEGLSCVHWDNQEPVKISGLAQSIVSNTYFHVERQNHGGFFPLGECQILFCARGVATLGNGSIRAGQTYLIPAVSNPVSDAEAISLQAQSGGCELIVIRSFA